MNIIDIHTHPLMDLKHRTRIPAQADLFMEYGRSYGVSRMVVLGAVLMYGRNPNAQQIANINDDTAKVVRRRPDYFIGFCYLNPTLGERAVERELERCVGGYGFRGIKLEVANNARDACMKPVMRAAERWGIPVLQHSWSMTNIHQRRWHTDPADTALLARRHPNVQVIMAHLTGCGYRGILEVKGLDNLVVDTSGGYPESNLIQYALDHLGADHIIYGSDLPIRENCVTLGNVRGTPMSPAEREKILSGNARRLLKL